MKKTILSLLLLTFSAAAFAQNNDPNLGIVPAPASIKTTKSEFKLNPETIILVDSPDGKQMRFLAAWLKKNGFLNELTNIANVDKKRQSQGNTISLLLNFKGEIPFEGYEMNVGDERVTVKGHGAGMFYGIQTLIQLIHRTNNPGYATIPGAVIKDAPRFSYRGMHLDVARHFFDVAFIKKYIDVMAMYKLNYFHWHLTDDQGWRIEIKKYPKLTEIGSKRAQTVVGKITDAATQMYDNTPYGGFYTQDEVTEIVKYAYDRYITIVPEIEMPGHALAAIAAYPELSCDPKKTYKVGETWGVSTDVFCPTDANFKMLDEILLEVMILFPGKYIHIGGDECPKDAWRASDYCRQFISDQNLRDENGLQSYFIKRIEKFVNVQGHQIIGWDEILDGGIAPNATVMSWRGEKGGISAAQLNHDVIMTPGSGGMYFDHAQSKSPQEPLSIGGNAPLEKTYSYNPVPEALSAEQQKHIIGVQANLWTEYIATPQKAEYMLLPRMLALSEVAWTSQGNKDYKNFSEKRIPKHLVMLDGAGYNYRVPVAIGASDTTISGNQFNIQLEPSVEGALIHYTIDGQQPSETDLTYKTVIPFTIPEKKSVELKSIVVTPSGKKSISSTIKMVN